MVKVDDVFIIDLQGPDGNAFALLGISRSWAKQVGLNPIPDLTVRKVRTEDGDVEVVPIETYQQLLDNFDATWAHRIRYRMLNDPRKDLLHEDDEDEDDE